ncbi:hypothetical protein D3Y59_02895 [Hymenobacter oligotrophus]|uniref:Uncharacterized protein n=1 Tax=Hymenobacter oligotrophus TaxID=2319843 RepID=A0A3B7RPF5_9BACT|nr:hypothetical protein [Hymenobacter oligotrophus]AYA36097.1 hypothetical protein D3Y59_02895 [Hymenobacter oligotrophus]
MRLIPSEEHLFTSPLSVAQVLQTVQANTASSFVLGSPEAPFRGSLQGNNFAIWRLSLFTNWANRPHVTGRVAPNPNGAGSVVWLRQRANLVAFWASGTIALLLATGIMGLIWDAMPKNQLYPPYYLFPFIIPVFVFSFTLVPFKLAAAENRSMLTGLLRLQPSGKA